MSEPSLKGAAYSLVRNHKAIGLDVESIRVTHEVSTPTMFEFVVPVQSIRNPWSAMQLENMRPGDEISIALGRGSVKPMVTGDVTLLWPQVNADPGQRSKITVAGFDRMERLRFGAHTRTFVEYSDLSIMREVARTAGLSNVRMQGRPGKPLPYVLQNDESDYDFLIRRCAECDYEMLMQDTTLVFRPSAQGLGEIKALQYYKDFDRVSLKLSVPRRGSSVTVTGYDLRSGEKFEGRANGSAGQQRIAGSTTGYAAAGSVLPQSPIGFSRPDITDRDAAQDYAEAQYARGTSAFITGTVGLFRGDETLTAGTNVELLGLGGDFDGLYYISKSTHLYEQGAYQTELEVRRNGI
ncbi:phage late control D family protein [Trinickia dinghuensis]|uniref:Phage late control D family protein n=1 Tax=Trinickia dinghuensis TaxID=2291023 RepID=A0A3D8JW26_9BURK|nr:contractile injection system protein, VgrG/Pvc8 family [Trinickia dinghuensis]RDU97343.1 hypothetical protein DWV00_19120 [Trinickia dinghuensis]